MIHVYTGDGKGKTTAAVGLAVRYAGSGKNAEILQFLKDGTSSELCLLKSAHINVTPCQTKTKGFFWEMNETERENLKEETEKNFNRAISIADNVDMIVLDEIMCAISNGLIAESKVIDFLKDFGDKIEIVITGRNASEEILKIADYVSEIRKIKHPYDKGVDARIGIEY